jgi:hypothetical protein
MTLFWEIDKIRFQLHVTLVLFDEYEPKSSLFCNLQCRIQIRIWSVQKLQLQEDVHDILIVCSYYAVVQTTTQTGL